MEPSKRYQFDLKGTFVGPTVGDLQMIEWMGQLPPDAVETYRKLRRDKLLWIRSMQMNVVNAGQCVPGVFCDKCPVAKLEARLTGFSGPVACSLVAAMLAVEMSFYSVTVAQDDCTCNLCGLAIVKGSHCVSVTQFGYNPLRLHPKHLTGEVIWENPTVGDLQVVEWMGQLPPDAVETYGKLRRDDLLGIWSMQMNVVKTGQCVPGVFCDKCPVAKLEGRLTKFGGPVACSLVAAMLAVERNFFRITVAQEDYTCNLCGLAIGKGSSCVSVIQFGFNPLRLHPKCLTGE